MFCSFATIVKRWGTRVPKQFRVTGWFHRWCGPVVGSLTAAVLLAPAAGHAQNITYSEAFLGVLQHDVHFLGGKEKGVDINPEFDLASPIDDETMMSVPWMFRWMVQPRPTIGGIANTSGFTDQAYLGLTWKWWLVNNVFRPEDGFNFGFFFGPGYNDGEIHSNNDTRKNLGSNILFRESAELGYQITPVWQVSAYLDHISNGGLAKYNQSINNFGGRFGFRF